MLRRKKDQNFWTLVREIVRVDGGVPGGRANFDRDFCEVLRQRLDSLSAGWVDAAAHGLTPHMHPDDAARWVRCAVVGAGEELYKSAMLGEDPRTDLDFSYRDLLAAFAGAWNVPDTAPRLSIVLGGDFPLPDRDYWQRVLRIAGQGVVGRRNWADWFSSQGYDRLIVHLWFDERASTMEVFERTEVEVDLHVGTRHSILSMKPSDFVAKIQDDTWEVLARA